MTEASQEAESPLSGDGTPKLIWQQQSFCQDGVPDALGSEQDTAVGTWKVDGQEHAAVFSVQQKRSGFTLFPSVTAIAVVDLHTGELLDCLPFELRAGKLRSSLIYVQSWGQLFVSISNEDTEASDEYGIPNKAQVVSWYNDGRRAFSKVMEFDDGELIDGALALSRQGWLLYQKTDTDLSLLDARSGEELQCYSSEDAAGLAGKGPDGLAFLDVWARSRETFVHVDSGTESVLRLGTDGEFDNSSVAWPPPVQLGQGLVRWEEGTGFVVYDENREVVPTPPGLMWIASSSDEEMVAARIDNPDSLHLQLHRIGPDGASGAIADIAPGGTDNYTWHGVVTGAGGDILAWNRASGPNGGDVLALHSLDASGARNGEPFLLEVTEGAGFSSRDRWTPFVAPGGVVIINHKGTLHAVQTSLRGLGGGTFPRGTFWGGNGNLRFAGGR